MTNDGKKTHLGHVWIQTKPVFVYFLASLSVMYFFNSTLYLYQTLTCQRRVAGQMCELKEAVKFSNFLDFFCL